MVDADNIGYYTPAIVVSEDYIFPLAIFEPGAWPRRPQYQQVVSEVRPVVILPDGTLSRSFHQLGCFAKKYEPCMIVRQIRESKKPTFTNIIFLRDLIRPEEYQVGVLDIRDAPAYKEAFKALISGVKKDDVNVELLQKIFLVDE